MSEPVRARRLLPWPALWGMLLGALIMGCVSTVPQLYQQPIANATLFRLGILQRPEAIEVITPASTAGQQPTRTYEEQSLKVVVEEVEGQVPTILYWILEIEGPDVLTGDSTLSVFAEGSRANTETVFEFPLAKLGRSDAITGAQSALNRKRNYTLKAVWENSFRQTNVTTSTQISFIRSSDGTRSRNLNPRDPNDAQIFLNGKLSELQDNTVLPDGTLDPENPVYPSAATALLLNRAYNNIQGTPAVTFELTSRSVREDAQ